MEPIEPTKLYCRQCGTQLNIFQGYTAAGRNYDPMTGQKATPEYQYLLYRCPKKRRLNPFDKHDERMFDKNSGAEYDSNKNSEW